VVRRALRAGRRCVCASVLTGRALPARGPHRLPIRMFGPMFGQPSLDRVAVAGARAGSGHGPSTRGRARSQNGPVTDP
jgi:hypothetical protein